MADDDWAKAVDEQESKLNDSGITKQVEDLKLKENGAVSMTTGTAMSSSMGTQPKASGDSTKEDDEKPVSKAEASLITKLLHNRLVPTKSDLEILQKDPNSPLYSVKSFEALHLKPELLKGVYDMGFNAPSKIQETALPTLLADPPTNMIAQSQSGTGKTAAFVLTMLSRVDTSLPYPQCLCLAPTYELALQIGQVTQSMSKHMQNLVITFAVRGGQRVNRGEKVDAHIIIGTPGTVLDWAIKFKVFDTKKINVFVLDEADVMIDTQGHQDQSIRIQRGLRKDCQMLLFSATYDTQVMKFANAIVSNPFVIRLRKEEESLDNIRQFYIECRNREEKFVSLTNIYGSITIGQTMIFCQTRATASWLSEKMTADGHAVALLSGELTVEQRAAVIQRFRDGKEKVLITTNVSARGIDVEQVTVVVNFDLPVDVAHKPDYETYLHRIGRTGRFGKQGLALNMVDGHNSMQILQAIEKHFGKPIKKLNTDDVDELEKLNT